MASVGFDNVTVAVDGALVLRDVSLDISGRRICRRDRALRERQDELDPHDCRLHRCCSGAAAARRNRCHSDQDGGSRRRHGVPGTRGVRRRNVRRNVSFPLETRRQEAAEIRDRVDAEARAMHLEHLLARRPDELSRGETQLVQIARAMVRTPPVLLLDEPPVRLDTARQAQMRTELAMLQSGYGVTTVIGDK